MGVQVFLGKDVIDLVLLGFFATDELKGIERIIGSNRWDIFFGEEDGDNTLFGEDGQDILRSVGRETAGNYLAGGNDDDALVLDAGGDEAHGNAGSDLFYVAFKDASDTQLLGNVIYGGDGDRENGDPGIDILKYDASKTNNYTVNEDHNDVLFADPARFGKDLDLTELISGGFVEIYAGKGEVLRFLNGSIAAPSVDQFFGIEVLIGSNEADYILADGDPGQIFEILGDSGNDVFDAPGVLALTVEGARDLSVIGTTLKGNRGDDTFHIGGLYDIEGGNDTDTLYLTDQDGLGWYLNLDLDSGKGLLLADEAPILTPSWAAPMPVSNPSKWSMAAAPTMKSTPGSIPRASMAATATTCCKAMAAILRLTPRSPLLAAKAKIRCGAINTAMCWTVARATICWTWGPRPKLNRGARCGPMAATEPTFSICRPMVGALRWTVAKASLNTRTKTAFWSRKSILTWPTLTLATGSRTRSPW